MSITLSEDAASDMAIFESGDFVGYFVSASHKWQHLLEASGHQKCRKSSHLFGKRIAKRIVDVS